MRIAIIFILISVIFLSCGKKHDVKRSFYFWKTKMDMSSDELKIISDLKVRKLYTRFFDVDDQATPKPVAIIDIIKKPGIEIIPVVFITNNTLLKIGPEEVDSLAIRIAGLVEKIATKNSIRYRELQLDCDWTLKTRNNYFKLLSKIRELIPLKQLSATIRLHQVKYPEKTGVPPVDKGMLMFYNMGNIQDTILNSIYNEKDASRYSPFIKNYRLPLDVAVPFFRWIKIYRNNKVTGIFNNVNKTDIQKNSSLVSTSDNRYIVTSDVFFNGRYLYQGDRLVVEEVSPDLTLIAARHLKKYLQCEGCSVVLYHWDEQNLFLQKKDDIEAVYKVFE